MKVLLAKALALGGLCALFASVGGAAVAQGYYHRDMDYSHNRHMAREAHQRLQRLHAIYYHAINNGNYAAARRAHLQANAIRARMREHWIARY